MKTVLMTGLTGTLAPKVAHQFHLRGWNILEWNHHQISPDDPEQSEQFWQQHHINAVCHMAMGSEEWAAWLGEQCKRHNIPYLFVSTAMVFDATKNGPYGIFEERNTQDDYGKYKVRCEDAIWQANPDAMVARIGWQLHHQAEGNNMLAHLNRQHEEYGVITASTAWYPATSHMDDTALAFLQLIERNEAGLYHLDSNLKDKWNFYELVCALKQHYNKPWQVLPSNDYHHDQRLTDERIALPPLSERFNKSEQIQQAGIIGINWGRTHIPHYRNNGVSVTTLCANQIEPLQQACSEEAIPKAETNISALKQLDVVTIATPAHTHAEIIKKLGSTKLICEKPLVGLNSDITHWQQPNANLLVNYAFAQLNTAKTIEKWLASQTQPCVVNLVTQVNLPGTFTLKEWFLETASHPISWLLHCFGDYYQSTLVEENGQLIVDLQCDDHQLRFVFELTGEPGIEHNLTIQSNQTLTSKGYYRVGEKWRFEPILVNGNAINDGEYSESDCWQDANQRSVGLMLAMFNQSISWDNGLQLGAFDAQKAILIEKMLC
ncbi:sugar nucleotide-binding protein [Vibrio alginolyticus]|uniref:sugar nucleotide-binding protein n=1 Tax=Vibrio alginolyticus TaxID=663 RepID=UPI00079650B8|nr:sugar nucleotide-binding protein [Vibrio alginolyticus]KXZ34909.1 dTDP-4-dehydrorhamnose reductase [Vibrio alginolyticus]MBT0045817.1 sugar nucleotide-binding protein [Vibrio alginolyticus]